MCRESQFPAFWGMRATGGRGHCWFSYARNPFSQLGLQKYYKILSSLLVLSYADLSPMGADRESQGRT